MIHNHQEIEVKLAAEGVSVEAFTQWVMQKPGVHKYLRVSGPDRYYSNGDAVVRHREAQSEGRNELTVKLRKSGTSTRDRLEVDLHIGGATGAEDIAAFLEATGFKKEFTLVKDAYIFFVKLTDSLEFTFVIYDVWKQTDDGEVIDKRRYIEAEAEKGSNVQPETAKRHLRNQVKTMQEKFKVGDPLNQSLWEIYSGNRYQSVA